MTDEVTSCGEVSKAPRGAGTVSIVEMAFPWLLRQRVTVPDRVPGYVHRAELVSRVMPTRRRLTVLNAGGGFGKTTLLAECCRMLREDGVATAWISADEYDEPEVLDIYIAFACQAAGLDLLNVSNPEAAGIWPGNRVGLVVHEIQALGRPFVIAFDELERMRNPAAVSLLEFLLQRGPPNLHLAIACRQIPDRLSVAGAVLEGRAEVVDTEEMRFSKSEAARFFELSLSRRGLAAEMERSAGWPFALRISRNRGERGVPTGTGAVQDVVTNWIESRLFSDLTNDDRDLVLDIGLFDWMDPSLVDEALHASDSMRRLNSMRALVGLLEPVGGGESERWRLHPLVREHCIERRFREDLPRFRAVHRRIAVLLSRRGDTVSAMRHAFEGGATVLAGEFLERAGGVRLWFLQGLVPLQSVDRFLSAEVVSTRPRQALVRCLALLMSQRLDEARKLFSEVAAASRTGDRNERDLDFDYLVDECIVRGAIALYGAEPVGSEWVRTLSADYVRLVESQRLVPVVHAHMEYALCVLHQIKAEFDAALERLAGARRLLAQSQYMSIHGELLRGQVAMAQGHVVDAQSHYRTAQRMARKIHVLDPISPVGTEVMLQELALECSRSSSEADLRSVPRAFMTNSAPFSVVAAASGVVIELNLRDGRIDQALTAADQLLAHARGAALTSLARYLAALRASVLVVAGRVGDAERSWRLENLPEDAEGCVDLNGQTWREMEAVACARLRCDIATGRLDEGRRLARGVMSVAAERRLRRTLMRILALSIALEQHAGERSSAMGHLEAYLSLFAEFPYAWPLVRERATCAEMVTTFLELNPESPCHEAARAISAAIRHVVDVRDLELSERERMVLQRLEGRLLYPT